MRLEPPESSQRACAPIYERLRGDALAGGAHGWRWGRSLIARAGVAGWIRAWSEHTAANDEAIVKSPATPRPSTILEAQQLGATSGTSGSCTAVSAPRDREAIVALLALMLRGLLSGAQSVGANA